MNVNDKHFLDQKDGRFTHFRRVLDAKMKDLLSKRLGTKVRRADPVSEDDEEMLWDNGVFGDTNSTALQYCIFFTIANYLDSGGATSTEIWTILSLKLE